MAEEKIEDSWYIKEENEDGTVYQRLDFFWSKVFSIEGIDGRKKYQNLKVVVKACSVLAHGNADSERGFSANLKIIHKGRSSFNVRSVQNLRTVKDTIKLYGDVMKVPITLELINAAIGAYSQKTKEETALLALEKENEELKKRKEEERRKASETAKEAADKEKLLLEKESKILKKIETNQRIVKTSSERVSDLTKKKKYAEIDEANVMIGYANQALFELNDELASVRRELTLISASKSAALKRFGSHTSSSSSHGSKKAKK